MHETRGRVLFHPGKGEKRNDCPSRCAAVGDLTMTSGEFMRLNGVP